MSEKRAIKVLAELIAVSDVRSPVAIRSVAAGNTENAAVCVTYIFTLIELGLLDVMHG
jgi:hypothetical protein